MAVSEEFQGYIVERLQCIGEVVAKRMFGGLGFYLDGVHFALASNNTLYFKVDDTNRADYEGAGMDAFKPFGEESYSMSYYEVHAEVLENDKTLREWTNNALAAAENSRRRHLR